MGNNGNIINDQVDHKWIKMVELGQSDRNTSDTLYEIVMFNSSFNIMMMICDIISYPID